MTINSKNGLPFKRFYVGVIKKFLVTNCKMADKTISAKMQTIRHFPAKSNLIGSVVSQQVEHQPKTVFNNNAAVAVALHLDDVHLKGFKGHEIRLCESPQGAVL